MPKYDVVYQVKDGRGFPGDLKQTTVDVAGPQVEWMQVAVSHKEDVGARDIHVVKAKERS